MTERYPEHIKMRATHDKSHAIVDFVSWLTEERGVTLIDYDGMSVHLKELQVLLADFFEIDLDKVEQERVKMLDEIQQGMVGE